MNVTLRTTVFRFLRGRYMFFSLLMHAAISYAQEMTYPSFLWEITGKELKKPSYLLGSLHLKDSRLIGTNDSIFIAIANTDAFATELHPDSVYKEVFEMRFGKKQPFHNRIELTPVQKEEFIKRYKKEYGVPPDSTEWTNPLLVRSILNPKHDKEDNIASILDTYLYGLAKSMRKKIIGLEPLENQLRSLAERDLVELKNSKDSTTYYRYFEDMIQKYTEGDLQWVWQRASPYLDLKELENRNRTMLSNLIEELKHGTVCAVVGAAHLPDELGLIHLLKEMGYTLRPVRNKKTELTSMHKIDYNTMNWTTNRDTSYSYVAQLPEGYVYKSSGPFESRMIYGDLSTETELLVTANYVGNMGGMAAEEFLEKTGKEHALSNEQRLLSQKKLEKGGIKGIQFVSSRNEVFFRRELWLKNNTIYELLGYTRVGKLEEGLSRFFETFEILQQKSYINTEELIVEGGAFAIKTNTTPQHRFNLISQKDGDKELQHSIHSYFAVDKIRKINFLLRYNDYPSGYILSDKAAALEGMLEPIKNLAATIDLSEPLQKNGITGQATTAYLEKSNIFIETWIRGNRIYMLMQENLDKNNKEKDNQFFDSFRLLPYKQMEWKDFTIENMKITLPVASWTSSLDADSADTNALKTNIYAAIDSNSSTAYILEKTKLPKYFRTERSDTLYAPIYKDVKTYSEQLLKFKALAHGDITVAIFTNHDTEIDNYNKRLYWTRGDELYSLNTFGSKEAIENIDVHRLIKSIQYTGTVTKFDLYSSKAELIVNDLSNIDTAVGDQAMTAILTYYEFKKDELPIVYKALNRTYHDDDESDGIRVSLINKMIKNHDEQSVPTLKKIFNAPATTAMMRSAILTNICDIDSTQMDWYLEELNKHRPETDGYQWQLFQPLRRSGKYVMANLDRVTPLFEVSRYRPSLLNIYTTMLEDSTLTDIDNAIEKYLPNILQYMDKDLNDVIADIDGTGLTNEYSMVSYLQLLTIYDQKKRLQKFGERTLKLDSLVYLQTATAAAFLALDLPVNQQIVNRAYENLSRRTILMNLLKQAKRLDLIPAMYKEQTEIGRMIVNELLESELSPSSQIEFLGQLTQDNQSYLVYKYQIEDDKHTYYAVYKPQNGNWEYDYENCHSDFVPNKIDWQEHAIEIIKQMNGT